MKKFLNFYREKNGNRSELEVKLNKKYLLKKQFISRENKNARSSCDYKKLVKIALLCRKEAQLLESNPSENQIPKENPKILSRILGDEPFASYSFFNWHFFICIFKNIQNFRQSFIVSHVMC